MSGKKKNIKKQKKKQEKVALVPRERFNLLVPYDKLPAIYKLIAEQHFNPFGSGNQELTIGVLAAAAPPTEYVTKGLVPAILFGRHTFVAEAGGRFTASPRFAQNGAAKLYVMNTNVSASPTNDIGTDVEGQTQWAAMATMSSVKHVHWGGQAVKVNYAGVVENVSGSLYGGNTPRCMMHSTSTFNSYAFYGEPYYENKIALPADKGITVRKRYDPNAFTTGTLGSDTTLSATVASNGGTLAAADLNRDTPFVDCTGVPTAESFVAQVITYVYLDLSEDGNCHPRLPVTPYLSNCIESVMLHAGQRPLVASGHSFRSFIKGIRKAFGGVNAGLKHLGI